MKPLIAMALGLAVLGGSAVSAQDWNRDRDHDRDRGGQYQQRGEEHHDWGDRDGFQREWGGRGADWDHQWRRGDHLPDGYWSDRRYRIDDYDHHRLPRPRYGYHWVRYGDRFVMVRDRDGYVYRIIRDLVR